MSHPLVDISVVICAYTEERISDLVAAVSSIDQQTLAAREVIVVIDHNPALFERVRFCLPHVIAVENKLARGVSGSRNIGVASSRGAVIAFLDDDAEALPNWLERLAPAYVIPEVLGVGGSVEPLWLTRRPWWFPEEFAWVVGGSYKGMPEVRTPVRNVWSGNMSVRRDVFWSIGGFRAGFGKTGPRSRPEDTDFCIRAAQTYPNGHWLYEPSARVLHRVPSRRARFSYFVTRCYSEGRGKAELSRLVGPCQGTQVELSYAVRTLPRGVMVALLRALRTRDKTGFAQTLAMIAGSIVAIAGFVQGFADAHSLANMAKNPAIKTASTA